MAGFSGIAATTWAAEPLTTPGRFGAGGRSRGTWRRFGSIANLAISSVGGGSDRRSCTGRTTVERCKEVCDMRVCVTARSRFCRWGADTSAPASSTLTPELLRRGSPMARPDDLPNTSADSRLGAVQPAGVVLRLLTGPHGPQLRRLVTAGSPSQQIARPSPRSSRTWCRRRMNVCCRWSRRTSIECECRRQLPVRLNLRLQIGDLLLGSRNGVGTGDKTARRRVLVSKRNECARELPRVAGLLPVL